VALTKLNPVQLAAAPKATIGSALELALLEVIAEPLPVPPILIFSSAKR
jgi:hypothetical protein